MHESMKHAIKTAPLHEVRDLYQANSRRLRTTALLGFFAVSTIVGVSMLALDIHWAWALNATVLTGVVGALASLAIFQDTRLDIDIACRQRLGRLPDPEPEPETPSGHTHAVNFDGIDGYDEPTTVQPPQHTNARSTHTFNVKLDPDTFRSAAASFQKVGMSFAEMRDAMTAMHERVERSRFPDELWESLDVLGITLTGNEELCAGGIKSAYRSMAQIWHPDKAPANDAIKQAMHVQQFKRIKEAHDTALKYATA